MDKVNPYFRFHHLKHFREPCRTVLMKKVKSPSGNRILYPNVIYCYKGVIDSLKEMMKSPGFSELCEHWRHLSSSSTVYNDVYDGWKDFQSWKDVPFLSVPFNLALHLNVDWFQPYESTQHSEGNIYLSVMNLPTNIFFYSTILYSLDQKNNNSI